MTKSETINDLAAALAKAQKSIKGAKKDSANPFFKSKYADLASVSEACREWLALNEIAVIQAPSSTEDGRVSVSTMLLHASGQWIEETLSVKPKDDGPQAMGSCITYLRRYALAAFAGVAPEDDDGEAAEGRKTGQSAKGPIAPELPLVPPKGYEQWLADYETVADEGAVALHAAFKASKVEFRDYLTKHDTARHESLKARAAKAHHAS